MWKELTPPPRVLPADIITVDRKGKFRFSSKGIKKWKLERYHAVKISQDDVSPDLIAIQLLEAEGRKTMPLRHNGQVTEFSASWLIKACGIEPGRYPARKDAGLIIVDFSEKLSSKALSDLE